MWKYERPTADNPFRDLIEEAKKENDAWAPITVGFFNGSFKRFEEIAGLLEKRIAGIGWM